MSGVVAAGDRETVNAAIEILRRGGNAVDAAIAAAMASFLAEPMLSSAGGAGVMTVALAGSPPTSIDFFSNMPGLAEWPETLDFDSYVIDFGPTTQEFHIGRGAAAVPGTLPGLAEAHHRFGSLPLAELIAPAVRLAEDGMVVPPNAAHVYTLLWGILARDEDTARVLGGGRQPRVGDRLRNPELAQVLREFAAQGKTPDRVFEAMLEQFGRRRGGLISERDILDYHPRVSEPRVHEYGPWSVYCAPTPGGELAMHILDTLAAGHVETDEAAEMVRYARASAAGHARRQHVMAPGSTTQMSVVDAEGGAASITLTNGEGCGHLIPGTGIQLNNFLGEGDINPDGFHRHRPGRRLPTMMAPAVGVRAGRPALAIGSGGSNRIRTAVGQTLYRAVALQQPIEQAVRAPRVHAEDDTVWIELEDLAQPQAVLDALGQAFADVRAFPKRDFFFGGVHAAALDPAGRPHGIGDSRRGGAHRLTAEE